MDGKQLLSLYGLKWNPFVPELPDEALIKSPKINHFCWRVENLIMDGGFALITGDSGLGKSVALRILYNRIRELRDVTACEFTRPQSGLSDFYRELGLLFGLDLNVRNRYGGFSALRERWQSHIESTLLRPVLFIDEAQDMQPGVLSELRTLSSLCFDSKIVLAVILSGDSRLPDKFRTRELVPLGNRMRARLTLEPRSRDELVALLEESLRCAGCPKLMTTELMNTLAEHALGNPRVMMNMANELLMLGAKQEQKKLDEKLYFEAFGDEHLPLNRKRVAA